MNMLFYAFFSGETMLHLAAGCGNEEAGLFLVNNGANCSAANSKASFHKHCTGVITVYCVKVSMHYSELLEHFVVTLRSLLFLNCTY